MYNKNNKNGRANRDKRATRTMKTIFAVRFVKKEEAFKNDVTWKGLYFEFESEAYKQMQELENNGYCAYVAEIHAISKRIEAKYIDDNYHLL